jgi:peptidoglycan/LPS O-acetylase OafA/YrhL
LLKTEGKKGLSGRFFLPAAASDSNRIKIPGLDLLRCFACVIVLGYHLMPTFLPGGFIGVDIFFVLSGYLITLSLLQSARSSRGVHLATFYADRLRRLLPEVFLMLLVVLSASLLISPDFRANILKQSAASAGFITNYFEILGGQSYEEAQLPHLFVHTWTLAVEMHFYIIWAAIVVFVIRWARRSQPGSYMRLVRTVLSCSALFLAGTSWLLMQVETAGAAAGIDPSPGYFATHSHFFSVMLGALVCVRMNTAAKHKINVPQKYAKPVCFALVAVSVLCVAVMAFLSVKLRFASAAPFRWGLLATSVLTCVAISFMQKAGTLVPFRVIRPAAWLGNRTFGIYLFHWPVFIILSRLCRGLPFWFDQSATIVWSVVLADVSYRIASAISRRGKTPSGKSALRSPGGKRALTALLAAVVLLAPLSGIALFTAPDFTELETVLTLERRATENGTIDAIYGTLSALDSSAVLADTGAVSVFVPQNPNKTAPDYYWTDDGRIVFNGGVTMLGDSVMLGASTAVRSQIDDIYIDAKISRSMRGGIEVYREIVRTGLLKKNVVIGLSTNYNNDAEESLDEILQSLIGQKCHVVLVTGFGSSGTMAEQIDDFAEYLRAIPEQYPFITIADWGDFASKHKELLYADNIHLRNAKAREEYTRILIEALQAVQNLPLS